MTERGVFAVDRGIWDHPLLASDDPFSKREAWLWLLSEAAWKPRRVRVAGIWIDLQRGQIAHSLRHLANEWQWTVKRIRSFLAGLEKDTSIATATDTGITVITICNYDEYQKISLPKGTPSGTDKGTAGAQEGHSRGTITNAGNTGNSSEANASGADAPRPPAMKPETPEAKLWRLGVTDLMALGVGEAQSRKLIGSWRRDTGDDCEGVLAAIMRAREYAVANPVAWITAALKPRKANAKPESVIGAADDLVNSIRRLNERPSGIRSGEGPPTLRLLPQG